MSTLFLVIIPKISFVFAVIIKTAPCGAVYRLLLILRMRCTYYLVGGGLFELLGS